MIAGYVNILLTQLRRRRLQSFRRRLRRRPNLGDLDRRRPISTCYGFDRGLPVDRHYIERFLADNQDDIRGRVLEIGDNAYTLRFGGTKVAASDVLDASPDNEKATFTSDLTDGRALPSETFDCVILTQTLQLIYDVRSALQTIHRILRPGGVLLVTMPGISRFDGDRWPWYWSFTTHSARRLIDETFPASEVSVEAHGNVLLAVAFLHGLATEELGPQAFEHDDPLYQLVITVRAVKAATADA